MTVDEILTTWRNSLDDLVETYGWTDDEGLAFLNEAVREACIRANLIEDSATVEDDQNLPICQISYLGSDQNNGSNIYAVSRKIIMIRRAKRADSTPLIIFDEADLNARDRYWETREGSQILGYVDRVNYLQFYPYAPGTDTITLKVVRMPLLDLINGNDVPEIPEMFHQDLVDWMLFKSYNKNDKDLERSERAKGYEDRFTKNFGARPSNRALLSRRKQPILDARAYSLGFGL